MTTDIILEFWGVAQRAARAARPGLSQPLIGHVIINDGITFYDLTDDPHDADNWRLIATRFPDLADLLPSWYVGSKSARNDSQSQLQRDVDRVRHLGSGASLADISETLTGKRTYGGAAYQRVKEVQEALKTSTTTPSERIGAGSRENRAA